MFDTTRCVALITGGTRGIGRAVAEQLAHEGYSLALVYAGNVVRAAEAVEELQGAGAKVLAIQADVADESQMASAFDRVENVFGGVDVVVHGAGDPPTGTLVDMDLADLDRAIRVNLRGTFVVDQQAARRIRSGGAIINFSSSITRYNMPGNLAYTATKAAVESLTLTLARELRGRDITVNAIAPGPAVTDMLATAMAGNGDVKAHLVAESPLERLGMPNDIAAVAAFLVGPGRWINGQVIFANGGAS